MALPPLAPTPNTRDMLSYTIRKEGEFPRTKFIAVMEYPDCTRECDGKEWKVVQDKRKNQQEN